MHCCPAGDRPRGAQPRRRCFGLADDASRARHFLQLWVLEVAQYEQKFGVIGDGAKKPGIKRRMAKEMFGESGAFRGASYPDYVALRKAINSYVEDKPLLGQGTTTCIDVGNGMHKAKAEEICEYDMYREMESKLEDAFAFVRSQGYGKRGHRRKRRVSERGRGRRKRPLHVRREPLGERVPDRHQRRRDIKMVRVRKAT